MDKNQILSKNLRTKWSISLATCTMGFNVRDNHFSFLVKKVCVQFSTVSQLHSLSSYVIPRLWKRTAFLMDSKLKQATLYGDPEPLQNFLKKMEEIISMSRGWVTNKQANKGNSPFLFNSPRL